MKDYKNKHGFFCGCGCRRNKQKQKSSLHHGVGSATETDPLLSDSLSSRELMVESKGKDSELPDLEIGTSSSSLSLEHSQESAEQLLKFTKWFRNSLLNQKFHRQSTLSQSIQRRMPVLCISLIAALGSVYGARDFAETEFADICNIPKSYRSAAGVTAGLASMLASAGVNTKFIEQNISQSSSFPLERQASIAWICALIATAPPTVLGLMSLGGATIYAKVLIGVLSSVSGAMLAKSGMLELLDKLNQVCVFCSESPDKNNKKLLIEIAQQANNMLLNMSAEDQKEWFDDLVEVLEQPGQKEEQVMRYINAFANQRGAIALGESINDKDKYLNILGKPICALSWFLGGMSVVGNAYIFSTTFMGSKIGPAVGAITSLPNWALLSSETEGFIQDTIYEAKQLSTYWEKTSSKEKVFNSAIYGASLAVAIPASLNAAGIAHKAFLHWFGRKTIANAASVAAGAGSFGINFRATRSVSSSLFRAGAPIDEIMYSLVEAYKASPPGVIDATFKTEGLMESVNRNNEDKYVLRDVSDMPKAFSSSELRQRYSPRSSHVPEV